MVPRSITNTRPPPTPSGPRAYFLTFACYGSWLHSSGEGSVDRTHNLYGTHVAPPDLARETRERKRVDQPPYELDASRRGIVLEAVHEVCTHRGWWLLAVHVRATHIHVVVQAGDAPEKVMTDLKAYASRRLNAAGTDGSARKRWSRHGSTRYLWTRWDQEAALHYVLYEQGEPMAVYAGPAVCR